MRRAVSYPVARHSNVEQHGLRTRAVGPNQRVVVGAGERVNSYGITNSDSLLFVPPSRTLNLADVFAQDTISLGRPVKLTIGLKLEDDPYSGWTPLPDIRASWDVGDKNAPPGGRIQSDPLTHAY
jgi:hypothetical protein